LLFFQHRYGLEGKVPDDHILMKLVVMKEYNLPLVYFSSFQQSWLLEDFSPSVDSGVHQSLLSTSSTQSQNPLVIPHNLKAHWAERHAVSGLDLVYTVAACDVTLPTARLELLELGEETIPQACLHTCLHLLGCTVASIGIRRSAMRRLLSLLDDAQLQLLVLPLLSVIRADLHSWYYFFYFR
jgi:hypothetical protein